MIRPDDVKSNYNSQPETSRLEKILTNVLLITQVMILAAHICNLMSFLLLILRY